MKHLIIVIMLVLFNLNGIAYANILEKYKDRYTVIKGASKSDSKWIEEYMSYNCNYCYASEEHVKEYLNNKPENIKFQRYQVGSDRASWSFSQAIFVAAKVSGVEEELHDKLFKYYHEDGGEFRRFEDVIDFAKEIGIYEKIDPHFFSDASLDLKLYISDKAVTYKITSVPTFIINGIYKLRWGTDMTPKEFASLVAALVELEPKTNVAK